MSLLVACLALTANLALAAPNFQGFEVDTGDWSFDVPASSGRVASGGGTLGVSSASGGYHAEVFNAQDAYAVNLGMGGYSFFGSRDPVYAGPFFQSIDVYVDPAWSGGGFWIDMAPADVDDVSLYAAEGNFRLTADGSSVSVQAINGPVIANITVAGWYTFRMTWSKGEAPTDLINMNLAVSDANGIELGAWDTQAIYPQDLHPGESQYLGNNSYVWITVWTNGFAGDVIAIDNVVTDSVPDSTVATPPIPTLSTWAMALLMGFIALLSLKAIRQRR